jgi:hypothetical protein
LFGLLVKLNYFFVPRVLSHAFKAKMCILTKKKNLQGNTDTE